MNDNISKTDVLGVIREVVITDDFYFDMLCERINTLPTTSSLEEMLERLPVYIEKFGGGDLEIIKLSDGRLCVRYVGDDSVIHFTADKVLMEAVAKMLAWLEEQGLINKQKS